MNLPNHIAIILDGNGRWAKSKGRPRSYGHVVGCDNLEKMCNVICDMGVRYLTVYAFSTENWNRPADEVSALMGLVLSSLEDEIFMKHNVRFRVIGDLKRLPDDVQQKLQETMDHTAGNTTMTMIVALSYSSRWEITKATREIARDLRDGKISEADITEDLISQHMVTNFMPDPDLLIRTGGELRISNYLLWQIAYSELYFCDTYWPDFMEEDLHKAIESFQNRQRRYGKTEAQVEGKEE